MIQPGVGGSPPSDRPTSGPNGDKGNLVPTQPSTPLPSSTGSGSPPPR
jgi:hypothetical protein